MLGKRRTTSEDNHVVVICVCNVIFVGYLLVKLLNIWEGLTS